MEEIVNKFKLQPHPEGGFFSETYRSPDRVQHPSITEGGVRSASTSILFLLTPLNVSRFHRIASDEVWHFYLGSPMTVVELREGGAMVKTVLGNSVRELLSGDMVVQHVVRAGTWFGSYGNEGGEYSLVGCTVAPGFDFSDFELASRSRLLALFAGDESSASPSPSPVREEIIRLTVGLP